MAIVYCDISLDFSKNPSGTIKNVYNADSVKQSIFTILQTRKGERVMRPQFGTNLNQMLFEHMNTDTADDIRYEVFSAISEWEDRVEINSLAVTPIPDDHVYIITLAYTVLNTPNSESLSIGLFTQ